MNWLNLIKSAIDKHKIISFDIFDTLLKRDLLSPLDVFDLVEKEYNMRHPQNIIKGFRHIRTNTEKNVRNISDKEDITLKEIYSALSFDQDILDELMSIELNIEKSVIVCNNRIKEIYDYAIQKNKTIIAISEMYLPKSFIEDILQKNGYNRISKVYLSSEIGLMKHTGNLFSYVLKENEIRAHQMIHIGDAKKSDWIAPLLKGIHIFPIKRHIQNLTYYEMKKEDSFNKKSVFCFLNNRTNANRLYQIGYEILGPFLYGFCTWIHKQKNASGRERLLFLARDGQIMQQAYQIIYPNEDTEYIYVSRRSLSVPLFHLAKTFENILNLVPRMRYISVNELLARLGLDSFLYEEIVKECGLLLDDTFVFDTLPANTSIQKLWNKLKGTILHKTFASVITR